MPSNLSIQSGRAAKRSAMHMSCGRPAADFQRLGDPRPGQATKQEVA
jgi:hypothetical protein